MPNALCDAVLICTVYSAHSATIGWVTLPNILEFFRLFEDQPVTCCPKHIKTRSTPQLPILYFITLEQTSSLSTCCLVLKWTKTTLTLSILLWWTFSDEFLLFSRSRDLLDRKEFLAIGCWYGLTTLYTWPCFLWAALLCLADSFSFSFTSTLCGFLLWLPWFLSELKSLGSVILFCAFWNKYVAKGF